MSSRGSGRRRGSAKADDELTPGTLADARAALRRRWVAEGWYRGQDLATLIDGVAARRPSVELVFEQERVSRTLTLQELSTRARVVEAGLHRLGLRPGDRMCVQLPHSPESLVLLLAALRRGIITMPVPTAAGDAEQAAAVSAGGVRLLVVQDVWRNRTAAQRMAAVAGADALQEVVVVGPDAPADLGFTRLERVDATSPDPVARSADDVAALLYTSGSPGSPKGVMHSSHSLLAEVATGWAALSGEERRHSFVPLPPGHIGGVLSALIPLVTGRPAAFLEPWDAGRALDLVDRVGATLMGAVPYSLIEMLEVAARSGRGPGSLRYCSVGGAGVPPVLIERAEAFGLRAARAYGLTEHPTVSSGAADDPLAVRAHSDGRVAPGSMVRIVDRSGEDVAAGEEGEIVTIGPDTMLGYTDPAADLAAHLPDGWFRTGDLGRLGSGGVLTVTGRLKELVIRGGVNISVGEVEAALARHPAVADVAVVGVPDPRLGERLLAVVVPVPGSGVDLGELRRHCEALGIARIKSPERLQIVEALPRGATGKVRRGVLTEQWPGDRDG